MAAEQLPSHMDFQMFALMHHMAQAISTAPAGTNSPAEDGKACCLCGTHTSFVTVFYCFFFFASSLWRRMLKELKVFC